MEKYTIIDKPIPRMDSIEKVTGRASYLDDFSLPGLLHGKILRSPHPHAQILEMDTREAERLPGVRAVITGKDVPDIKFSFAQEMADKYILCKEKVRYVGDEVAAVAAVDLNTAEKALSLIRVKYRELEAVFDPETALQENSPQLHPPRSNIAYEVHREFGKVERGFAQADYIFEDEFRTPMVAHCCMEPRGCIADYARGGRLTLWSPTQAPHTLRQELSTALGIPQGKVKVINLYVGGAFGSRLVMDMKEPIAALLSKKSGRPVKIMNSRQEEFATAKTRYPCILRIKTGVKKDGMIWAREVKMVVDNGAYNDKGPRIISSASLNLTVLYNIPHIKFDAYLVYTNKEMGTAFRGFGNPQMHFAMESQLDMIAHELGIDPKEIRLRNANKPNDVTESGAKISSCGLEDCILRAAEEAKWGQGKGLQGSHKRVGLGMAAMVHSGGGSRAYGYSANDAFIKVSEDGLVTLISSAVEIGQGTKTAMAQIVAEELGLKIDDVAVLGDDTDISPYDLGCYGSRSTYVCGNAAWDSAKNTKKEVFEIAAEILEAHPGDMVASQGQIWVAGSPQRRISFAEVAQFAVKKRGRPISGRGRFFDPLAPEIQKMKFGEQLATFAFACQVAKIEVDIETGDVHLLELVAAHDAGTVINPMAAEGQVEGALVQGIGFTLMENVLLERGKVSNSNLRDYKIPTSLDVPKLKTIFVRTNELSGPFGAKGIGEPGLVPTAPAIANAIYDAIGIRFMELPITPEKILAALKEEREVGAK